MLRLTLILVFTSLLNTGLRSALGFTAYSQVSAMSGASSTEASSTKPAACSPISYNSASYTSATQRTDEPYPIQAIQKWHHLVNQKPIRQKNINAKLGVSSTRVSAGSGLVLYCMTEGYTPQAVNKSHSIGPFTYRVQYENEQRLFQSVESMLLRSRQDYTDCTLIFRQVVPFPRAGRATINIFGTDKVNPIATVEVQVVDDGFHPWMPFSPSESVQKLQKADGKFDAVGHVAITKRRAVPVLGNSFPLIFQSPAKDGQYKTHLNPMAIPTKLKPQSGQLTLSQTGEGLAIHSKQKIVLSHPQHRFLARWWINGKPYSPKFVTERMAEKLTGKVILGKRLHLVCDTKPEQLGAKRSDKIEVQILYSHHGWKEDNHVEKLAIITLEKGTELLISNRLTLSQN